MSNLESISRSHYWHSNQ